MKLLYRARFSPGSPISAQPGRDGAAAAPAAHRLESRLPGNLIEETPPPGRTAQLLTVAQSLGHCSRDGVEAQGKTSGGCSPDTARAPGEEQPVPRPDRAERAGSGRPLPWWAPTAEAASGRLFDGGGRAAGSQAPGRRGAEPEKSRRVRGREEAGSGGARSQGMKKGRQRATDALP